MFEERAQRWRDFYDGKSKSVLLVHYWGDDYPQRPLPYPNLMKERYEWSLAMFRRQTETVRWMDDDWIPFLEPFTGTEILAEAFGCPVHLPGNDMPFALPKIKSHKELKNIRVPKIESSPLSAVIEMADKLRGAEPGALMRLPDIQSPFDIAALVWEKTDFFTAMYEEPNAVKELVSMTEELLVNFLDLWFERYGKNFIAHYPTYYMPDGITLSEDEAGSISADMFTEFCAPGLNRLAARYGRMGIHCCANAKHQWDNFKALDKLTVLNINMPLDIVTEAMNFFSGFCHIHPEQEKTGLAGRMRLIREMNCGTKDEGIEMCKKYREELEH
ncbi:MAG: uroporphyrinogen decarboxylase family protein [Defluviitaleaceae bacterium]|nr:uroporphyrinogen decarboxylase family protein [Defluviitaleaceae bacterium]